MHRSNVMFIAGIGDSFNILNQFQHIKKIQKKSYDELCKLNNLNINLW